MANEFEKNHAIMSESFIVTNVGAGTTPVDGTLSGRVAAGWKVPAGYDLYPIAIHATYDDARTGGTSTVKVTAAGVELANGPEALIDATNTLIDDGLTSSGDTVGEGVLFGVSSTGAGTFAPATAEADVIVWYYLAPA